MKTIYLDNAATTVVDKDVMKAMLPYFTEEYGNASSIHHKGQKARFAIEEARRIIAEKINASSEEIFFTSGGTESNNWAIKGIGLANKDKKHIITTKIEHDCVMNSCEWMEKQGWKVTYLNVDKEGFVNPKDLEKAITSETILVSIIHGNNEIGTIQNLEVLGKICKDKGVYFHTDACQSFTKTELDVKKQNLDLVTLNAHKIHGPKGVGALYVRQGVRIMPMQHGGGQERGKRSGTENVPGIIGFAKAVQVASGFEKMTKLRDKLITGISKIPGSKLNGPKGKDRLCNNVNFVFDGIEGEGITTMLDLEGFCTSTGSACSSVSLEPSHVLLGIGLVKEQAHGSLRISLSKYNTEEEVNKFLEYLPKVVSHLRGISPIASFRDWREKHGKNK